SNAAPRELPSSVHTTRRSEISGRLHNRIGAHRSDPNRHAGDATPGRARHTPAFPGEVMDIGRFWQIVDAARLRAGADTGARVEAVRAGLSGLPATELESFQRHYDEQIRRSYHWDLWGAAFVMNGGCSDDGFRYFRDWLVSEGRATFEAALENPESLAD